MCFGLREPLKSRIFKFFFFSYREYSMGIHQFTAHDFLHYECPHITRVHWQMGMEAHFVLNRRGDLSFCLHNFDEITNMLSE